VAVLQALEAATLRVVHHATTTVEAPQAPEVATLPALLLVAVTTAPAHAVATLQAALPEVVPQEAATPPAALPEAVSAVAAPPEAVATVDLHIAAHHTAAADPLTAALLTAAVDTDNRLNIINIV